MVKFQQNDQGLKLLVNELVASHIAKRMGVPTPDVAVVYVGETFLESNPKFQTLYDVPVRPGPQFGSRYFERVYDSVPSLVGAVINREDFANIIAFDVATDNHDRCDNHYDNVLLIPQADDTSLRLVSIDHGSCFGGTYWSATGLVKAIGTWCASLMPEMAFEIRGAHEFVGPTLAAKAITESCLEDIVLSVPSEWWSSEDERDAIISYVMGQAHNILPILCRNHSLFPKWVTHV